MFLISLVLCFVGFTQKINPGRTQKNIGIQSTDKSQLLITFWIAWIDCKLTLSHMCLCPCVSRALASPLNLSL